MHDIIVVGAGPAGMTAALYALRAGKSVLLIEKQLFGGQITYSPKVENYPAYQEISGNEFADKLFEQVSELGVDVEVDDVTAVKDSGKVKTVVTAGGEHECQCVIFATGAEHKTLGIANEKELTGSGVSYCAVCDGAFFKEKDVAVAGGGNTAVQEALYLSDICKTVYIIHRRDSFRADKQLIERMKSRENIVLVTDSVIEKINGTDKLSGLDVKNVKDGNVMDLKIDGLFVAVGQQPQNYCFGGLVSTDDYGYAAVDESCMANANGIFVAGDCRKKQVRQLTTAVSDGATAAVSACKYIDETA